MPAHRLKFTKRALEALPPAPEGKRITYHDTETKGLSLQVTSTGAKTFKVQRRVNGCPETVTLGRFPEMTVEQAGKLAIATHHTINAGASVNAKKRAAKQAGVTLGEVLEDYLKARSLKPRTEALYRADVRRAFGDWMERPIRKITKDEVEAKHRERGKRSQAGANHAMRVLRALFNFAAAKYVNEEGGPLVAENPVKRISEIRQWFPDKRRRTVIKPHQLPAWFAAVEGLQGDRINSNHEAARDLLIFLLLTGFRLEEGTSLRWSQVDLPDRSVTLHDTKNHEDHTLPLSDHLYQLLKRRKQAAAGSEYVFPSSTPWKDADGQESPIRDIRIWVSKVAEASDVPFTPHDLRRTFVTIAESLDIPAYALKRLLNHKTGADVTAGYIVIDVERLRAPMQRITDFILKAAGKKASAELVEIGNRKNGTT